MSTTKTLLVFVASGFVFLEADYIVRQIVIGNLGLWCVEKLC